MKTKHIVLSGLGVFVLWIFFWPSEKDYLNAQMAELCKKDGGVKIYETVRLPAEMFNNAGNLIKTKSTTSNNEHGAKYSVQYSEAYELKETVVYLKKGDLSKREGRLTRNHFELIRLSDNKVLSEAIQYNRAGGDRWSPGMHSQAHCPEGPIDIASKVLIKN